MTNCSGLQGSPLFIPAEEQREHRAAEATDKGRLNSISQGGDFGRKRANAPPSTLPWVPPSLAFAPCLGSNIQRALKESQEGEPCNSHGSDQHDRVRDPREVWGQSPN